MAPYTIEAITILTGVVICTILAVYILILKKNGWLGASSSLYRCPNRDCKKAFQKPVELKDLSETPIRVYPACPHCGINLEPVLASCVGEKSKLRPKILVHQKRIEMKMENSPTKIETQNPKTVEWIENSFQKSSRPPETEKSRIAVGNHNKLWIAAEPAIPLSASREQPETILKKTDKAHSPLRTMKKGTSNIQANRSNGCLEGCSNFLGYLESSPNGTVVPPACYSCPRRVDCHMRVRAIVSIYVDQVPTEVH